MSIATTSDFEHSATGLRHGGRYRATVAAQWGAVDAAWRSDEQTASSTLFQSAGWYEALYAAATVDPSVQPLIVSVSDTQTGRGVLRLALMMRQERNLRSIEFADFSVTDFNAPLVGDGAPSTEKLAREMWGEIVRVLPPADVIRFRKMPASLNGRPNPFALLKGARPCSVNGNILDVGEDWEAHRFSRDRTFRKELERSWRVFTRNPTARFEVATDALSAARVLEAMEVQQGTRMREVGSHYVLDQPLQAGFYRDLVARHIDTGFVVLTSLVCDEEVVGALLGIRRGDTYVMVRISNAGGQLKAASPGRIIIKKTMEHLHAQGVRKFDFSIGNYTYKRRFGVQPTPLFDYTEALSLKAIPLVARDRLAALVRKYPRAHRVVSRALGRPAPRDEG